MNGSVAFQDKQIPWKLEYFSKIGDTKMATMYGLNYKSSPCKNTTTKHNFMKNNELFV